MLPFYGKISRYIFPHSIDTNDVVVTNIQLPSHKKWQWVYYIKDFRPCITLKVLQSIVNTLLIQKALRKIPGRWQIKIQFKQLCILKHNFIKSQIPDERLMCMNRTQKNKNREQSACLTLLQTITRTSPIALISASPVAQDSRPTPILDCPLKFVHWLPNTCGHVYTALGHCYYHMSPVDPSTS